jgi:5'-3' exonuclease
METKDALLLIIDHGSVFWNAWHSSANEELSAAHDRCVRHVRFLREKYPHTHCAIACDSPQSKRKEAHPSYKSQRPEKDKAALEQLRLTKETLVADGLLLWESSGYEADDVIAVAVLRAKQRGMPVLIASADKDLLQLVDDINGIRCVSTKTDVLFTAREVADKFGVPPRQMRDWLVLVGDTSDNIAGVPGVGAKTAAKLLQKYDDLEALFAALERDPASVATPAIVKGLQESRDIVRVGVDLVTLRTDAPIVFEELFEKREVKPLVQVEDAEFEDANEDAEWPIPPVDSISPDAPVAAAPTPAGISEKSEPRQPPPEARAEPPAQQQALAVIDANSGWKLALEPRTFSAGWALAKCLFNSRLFNVASAEAALAIMMAGRSMGLDAVTSLRGFHIIKNKPVMSAALISGMVLASGKAKYFRIIRSTNEEAVYETWRKGDPEPIQMGFSIADAKRAQMSFSADSNWTKYARTMLRWRATAELARAVYPDVVMNVYVEGELDEEVTE